MPPNPSQHARLLQDQCNFDDSILTSIEDPQEAWDAFYLVTQGWFDNYYPLRTITIISRQPSFMTPEIKYLLRRKSRLVRRGRLEEASALAVKIGHSISRPNKRLLRDLDSSKGTKELWQSVSKLTKASGLPQQACHLSLDQLNDHYVETSTV